MNTMGEKIAELRKSKSMTQEELATRIGVSPQAISRWENNATMPDIMLLPVLADILDITIDELFSANKIAVMNERDIDLAPKAAYMSVLDVLCKSFKQSREYKAEQFLQDLKDQRGAQSGIRSANSDDAVYATDGLAVAYLAEKGTAVQLLEDDRIAEFFAALSNRAFRSMLEYLFEKGRSLTPAFAVAKFGISEAEALGALLDITKFGFALKTEIDNGEGNTLLVFKPVNMHLLPMLLFPMMRLAYQIINTKNSWYNLRG